MKITHVGFASVALFCGVSALSGCTGESSENDSSLSLGMGALKVAVGACAEARDACVAASADAAAESACKEEFRACKSDAVEAAMPTLDKGVKECTEQSHTCRKSADTSEEKQACAETLKACVDEDRGDHGKAADAAVGDGSPVAVCTQALHACIEGDAQAKECTTALRACLEATLEHFAQGHDRADGGTKEQGDRGKSDEHRPLDGGVSQKPEKPVTADAGVRDDVDASKGRGPKR